MPKPGTLGPAQPQPSLTLASSPALPTTHPVLWPQQTLPISSSRYFFHVLIFFLIPGLLLGLVKS